MFRKMYSCSVGRVAIVLMRSLFDSLTRILLDIPVF
jgi:hypothetical protein